MQFTPRLFLLILAAAPLLAATALWPGTVWVAAIYLLVLGVVAWADWRVSPAPGQWRLHRRHEERLSLAADNLVELFVTLDGPARPTRVWLRDTPPPTFRIVEGEPVLAGTVAAGETARFAYHLWPPRRGDYAFGDLYLRWESVLGLLRRQARYPAAAPVKVYPNIVDVRKYDLLLRRNRLWELGLRSTRIFGAGSEFERLRDYTPDDEYRRINWKATARRGKPITMEFETERSQNIYVFLDVGRMMRSPVGEVEKVDFAINAVLLLAYVATQKGDRVGLLTFDDRVINYVAPRSGKVQFRQLMEQLYAVAAQPIEPDYQVVFSYFAARQHKRGLALVFTDLIGSVSTEALASQLVRMRARHLPLLVTVSDPTVQKLARQPIVDSQSLYERNAAEQVLQERRLVLERLRHHGVHTLDAPADELSVAVIDRYLAMKERLLI
jgi:uncharacterized protein (DUF58 family)